MKTAKFLALIITLAALTFAAPAALADHSSHHGYHHGYHHGSDVSVSLGFWGGGPYSFGLGYGEGWRGCGYWGWGGYYPYYYPSAVYVSPYYPPLVVAAPVVVQQPVVVRQVVQQPPQYSSRPAQNADLSNFDGVRMQKTQLLNKLNSDQKSDKLQAISELAGYSFDDTVRDALVNILLSDSDPVLRKAVADSFGRVKNHSALLTLKRVSICDSDVTVRQAAKDAINRIKS